MTKRKTKQPAPATPWFVLLAPELGGRFRDFYKACGEEGVLDAKTKKLLMIALASVFRCSHCTDGHIRGALESGVSREEIAEALMIASVIAAGTQLAWAREIFEKHLNGRRKA
jgi:AhpD family alkylhydroperoxidase